MSFPVVRGVLILCACVEMARHLPSSHRHCHRRKIGKCGVAIRQDLMREDEGSDVPVKDEDTGRPRLFLRDSYTEGIRTQGELEREATEEAIAEPRICKMGKPVCVETKSNQCSASPRFC